MDVAPTTSRNFIHGACVWLTEKFMIMPDEVEVKSQK